MDIFKAHQGVVDDYSNYIRSFINIQDQRILQAVNEELNSGRLWPEPLIQFNPSFVKGGDIQSLVHSKGWVPELAYAFNKFTLYKHQVEAIELGIKNRDFVVTSGTGSGKSLTYVASIFNHLFKNPGATGIQAILVYPMNALINSQSEALQGFAENYRVVTGIDKFPITFKQYTGQEKEDQRAAIRANPPHILLTNYMMLELILTRLGEQSLKSSIFANLRFLVFDELHTFRGRQGADVAMLVRRITSQSQNPVTCIGTSATMISGGSVNEQKERVAEVASQFFGRTFKSDQIINETLARSLGNQPLPDAATLCKTMKQPLPESCTLDELRKNPMLAWLEDQAAVDENDGVLIRRSPKRVSEICDMLSDSTGLDVADCRSYLVALLHKLSLANGEASHYGLHGTILLPFKLHQFFAQTGAVYVTLDSKEKRRITLDPNQLYHIENDLKHPYYSTVFSRTSGEAFICVAKKPDNTLARREFKDYSEDDENDGADILIRGYLIFGDDVWSESDYESLPSAWVRVNRAGRYEPKPDKKDRFPQQIYIDSNGNWSDKPKEGMQPCWFMAAPLLFDPTSGVEFHHQTSETNKLSSLGKEGRSTSTTITCFSILEQLALHRCTPEFQKLLSFTDNRQDAALQAGHFNDFIKTVQFRAALYKALMVAPEEGLTIHNLGDAIFKTLDLSLEEYTNSVTSNSLPSVRKQVDDTLRDLLTYRALYDLRHGWRIVLPNLEQCALLKIKYQYLDELAADKWEALPLMAELDAKQRHELLETILETFRLNYALASRNHFETSLLRDKASQIKERLLMPWSLEQNDKLMEPRGYSLEAAARKAYHYLDSLGPNSGIAKYIFSFLKKHAGIVLERSEYMEFLESILTVLRDNQFLECQQISKGKVSYNIYRLRVDCIRWLPGDKKVAFVDPVRTRSYKNVANTTPNTFFQKLYQLDFQTRKSLRGDEHTGQLQTDDRLDREDRFREGKISALFCSPTMELGIDIKLLSIVHMRNVPPSPANYAQRAGRAGRSGQGALIFNFCSSYSPHDRHYFSEQRELVAGNVKPPRLDLCNEELLLGHLRAMVLTEIGLVTGGAANINSLISLVNIEDESNLPLYDIVREHLQLTPHLTTRIRSAFLKVVADFRAQLDQVPGNWFSESWIDSRLGKLSHSLDEALDRWRHLYKAARRLNIEASTQISSGMLRPGTREYQKAEREQRLANNQLAQLRNNQIKGRSTQISEFYTYRYLAAEAWLPGYNFTRLPLRIFIEKQNGDGEFLSRPRSIALSEYGPLNVIYHNGQKYRVNQLTQQSIEDTIFSGTVSTKAGYFLPPDQRNFEICPFSGAQLSEAGNKEEISQLLEMGESRASTTERITCEEEERLRRGYNIRTYFTVDAGHMDRVRQATLYDGDDPLLNIRYIPAVRLRNISHGWRSRKDEGFPISVATGIWKTKLPDNPNSGDDPEVCRKIKLTTSNTADALYLEPMRALGINSYGVLTLQYALLQGISRVFQVEPSELRAESMGVPEMPNILLYESAEGSLGILSQLVSDVKAFKNVINSAIELLRYDDSSYKLPASYDDLLSYYNQRDHENLNRFLIKDALNRLLVCNMDIGKVEDGTSYNEQYKHLCITVDPQSTLEREFIDHLFKNGLRLPDQAQKPVAEMFCQPDFYYSPNTWLFIDGSVHDKLDIKERDLEQRQRLRSLGHEVLEYNYRETFDSFTAKRPDIFRKVRE